MHYSEYANRDLRLVLLRALAMHPAFSANEVILAGEAEAFGHARSRDAIRNELNYLAEAGAVTLKDAGTVKVASLTRRGLEHVQGKTVLEGINQPSPGE